MYSEDIACDRIEFVNERNALAKFLAWCDSLKPRVLHVVYIHMLAFDIIELFWGMHERLIGNGGEFEFSVGGWDIKGLYGTPTFCSMSRGHDRRVVLVDSFSFYRGSLKQAAKLFCPDLPKLPRPRELGERRFTASDTGFVEYAMRDAVVAYHIGKSIEELHREFDLQQCISVADMAARIYRHQFLSYVIPMPPPEIVFASLDAYHGGKNNITVPGGWYEGVTGIDISSAYPDAMCQMPAFSNGNLYRRFRSRGSIKRVPDWGVYAVSGRVADCKWPSLFDHAFRPMSGTIDRVHIHGIEINEALRSGELRPTRIDGWCYDAERDSQASSMRHFCETFYTRKQNAPDKVLRYEYKTIQNAISGKFIQTRKRAGKCYVDVDTGKETSASELVAGGLFNPFIAAGITAHTRARMHTLEHQHSALHTATDGIFTQASVSLPDTGTRLGELTAETRGDLLLVRNKCYLVYSDTPTKDSIKSRVRRGRHIIKAALHGFQGTPLDLERLIATGKRTYKKKHANRLKESIKRGLTPNDFVLREYSLKVPEIKAA